MPFTESRSVRAHSLPTLLATLFACSACLALPSVGHATTTIGTTEEIGAIGGFLDHEATLDNATIGQVITAPSGQGTLKSFTFEMLAPTGLVFRPYVYAWDGTKATGPALYEGLDMHTADENAMQSFTVETGDVRVTPGAQYVLFLSASNDQAQDESTGFEGFLPIALGYSEGSLVEMNNGFDPQEWTAPEASSWTTQNLDLAFNAVFEATPTITAPVPAATATVATPVATVRCVVPTLRDLRLKAIESALLAAHCKLGKLTHHYNRAPKGELVEQSLHQTTIEPVGTTVDIWLSRGAHKRHHKHDRQHRHAK